MSSKVAVMYLRRSTAKQEQSIEDQRDFLTKYAAREGFTILCEYVDDAISGADTAKRDAFRQMIEDAEAGEFQYVLVYDVSRFSRDDPDEAGYWRHKLRLCGVEVVYAADSIPEGDEGDLVLSVQQWTKHQFLIHLSRDTLRGAVSAARKGYSAGKPAPYGYRRLAADQATGDERVLENGQRSSKSERVKLIPATNDEPATVRRIFEDFVKGHSYRTIAHDLNAEELPSPRGGRWITGTIRDLLLNPAYCGDAVYNRNSGSKFYSVRDGMPIRRKKAERGRLRHNARQDWIVSRDAHAAIVPRDLWEKAQRRIKDGRRDGAPLGPRASSPHLLGGLIACGACGHKMHGHTLTGRHKTKTYRYRRYVCSSALNGRLTNHQNAIRAESIERLTFNRIEALYRQTDVLRVAEDMLRQRQAAGAATSRRADPLVRRLAEVERALEAASRRILMLPDDELVAAVVAETKKLQSEREALRAEIATRQAEVKVNRSAVKATAAELRDFARHLREMYEEADLAKRKAFLRNSLWTPRDGSAPVVVEFTPAQNARRPHGQVTGGTIYALPLAEQFHRYFGGGSRIRTGE